MLHAVLNSGAQQASNVRVLSFDGDLPALATGPLLGLHAAASGTPTALIPEDHRGLDSLRATLTGPHRVGQGLPFTVGLDELGDPPRLVVSIVLLDADAATLSRSEGFNVLSISPGFATANELARFALNAANAGSPLDLVVVVNPDPADQTSGISVDDRLRLLPFQCRCRSRNWGLAPRTAGQRSERFGGTPDDSRALMEATMAEAESAVGPMISLRSLKQDLVRRRRVWIVTAMLGLLIGASLHFVLPEKYSAVTELYIVQPANSDPVLGMANDAALLQTQAVANRAISTHHLHTSAHTLLSHYSGVVMSNNIIAITFSSGSSNEASLERQGSWARASCRTRGRTPSPD